MKHFIGSVGQETEINSTVMQQIADAIELVKSGKVRRVDVNSDIKVYAVRNVIRIDVKCNGLG